MDSGEPAMSGQERNTSQNERARSKPHPLSGVQVLAFTHYAAGPIAAQYLGSLGADVIKVESLEGDYQRDGIKEPDADSESPSPYFLGMNRNQRSIAIDLKRSEAKEVVHRLLATTDVVLENFRPGALDRMGLGYAALSARYPRLIYCSIAAYDPMGAGRDRPGQDLIMQALSGIASLGGPADGPPVAAGGYIVDGYTASQAVIGILAALRQRDQIGEGQWVRVDMMSCSLHLLASETSYALNAKGDPRRGRNGISHAHQPAPYGIYDTTDGAIAIVSKPESLPEIATGLGIAQEIMPLLEGNGAWLHRDQIAGLLAKRLKTLSSAAALNIVGTTGALTARVRTVLEALNDPDVVATGMVRHIEHSYGNNYRVAIEPIKMTKSPLVVDRPSPALGEHTREILMEIGLTQDQISGLFNGGAVRAPDDPPENSLVRACTS
jgi:crotonobetainyl-CoA:carnitine CoA-transferase CaiB-like acyl-CoA transferase